MKTLKLIIVISIAFISCNLFIYKKIEYKQLKTDQKIYINYNHYKRYKDSVKLTIPIKFDIKNIKKYNFLIFNFKLNNHISSAPNEFIILEKDYKNYYDVPLKPNSKDIDEATYYLIPKNINISNKKAKEILSKYNIEFNKWGERFKDTIQLATYAQFKKDFPEIFDELNAVGDSLIITTSEKGQENFKSKKFPIKW